MKRQAAFLVRKRDGRLEWLRATKLSRSVHRALRGPHPAMAESPSHLERLASEVTSAVLEALGPEARAAQAAGRSKALRLLSDRDGAIEFVRAAVDPDDAEAREAAVRRLDPLPTASLAQAVEHALRCLDRIDAAERFASIRNRRLLRRSAAHATDQVASADGASKRLGTSGESRSSASRSAGKTSRPTDRLDSDPAFTETARSEDHFALKPRHLTDSSTTAGPRGSEPQGGGPCD